MNERVVVVNASKMNYDHLLDFSVLSNDVQVYDDSTNEEVIERIQGARVVVTKELPVGADLLSQFPDSVKLIVEAGTGYNNIDLDAARAKGITVCNIPAYSTERVAHTVIMMLLNFSSTMQQQIGMLAKGDRSNFTKYLQVSHTEVNGKTLGVVGAGHIGMEVIKVAKALGMNILVHTRTPKADGDGIRYVSLDELLENSDYITLHCPLNDQTKHIINKEAIGKMKNDTALKNIPVIAITAQAMTGDREKCLEAGADGYISKPVNVEELLVLLNKLID